MKNLKNKLTVAVAIAALSISASANAGACKAPADMGQPPQITCPSCGHKFDMPCPPGHGRNMRGHMMKMMQKECALLAELTGKDAKEIGKECREKKLMPAQYAKQAGVYDAYKAKTMERVKKHLDQRIKDGKLTKEQAAEKLERFSGILDKMSNGEHPWKGHHKNGQQK